mmetsp:Transcript_9244/g.28132  ORF Transcript_9244/g.28132 Transcript_9244/m.28132 type:complete len:227 (+) Transcript_9244:125-805(+)
MGLLACRSKAGLAFAFALCLLVCFSSQGAADNEPVTCGSTVKLSHVKSKHVLHSHEVSYSRGSQQQSVTAFPTSDDGNSYWVIHGTPDMPCPSGQTIAKKSAIRLQHATTRKWLHSHKFQSPLTSQQEVSAFGSDDSTDGGDIWIISWGTTGKIWKQDTKVKLQHRDTSMYLASYEQARFGQPIHGQLEVCAVARADANSDWQTAEGVFMPAENAGTDQHAGSDEL